MNRLIEGLNEAQRAAVQHKDGPLLVLAGPGSGKTRVVTHRIAWLLEQGVWASQIAALTFTNKAADEMKNRLARLVPDQRVWIGTFHRFCASLLRTYAPLVGLDSNYTIYDADQSKALLDSVVDRREFPTGIDSARIASGISYAKNQMVLPDDYHAKEGHILGAFVEKIYPEYQRALRNANAVDFDDLLLNVAVLLKENPDVRRRLDGRFRYILVDEYQDTNLIQYAIAQSLSIDYPNLAVTGDPDQSIYGWRGADVRNILEFEKDFADAKVVRLEENYRSTKNVLAVASALIKHNKRRLDKELFTQNGEGVLPRVLRCYNHQEEADFIAKEIADELAEGKRRPQDYAVFYRMNALSRNLERSFRRFGVPFQLIRGVEFFRRKEIKDVVSYLQFVYNPNDTIAFRRIVNLPARGIGKITRERIERFAEERRCSLLDAAKSVDQIQKITPRAKKAIKNFADLVERLGEAATENDVEVLLSILLNETRYLQSLQGAESEEDKQRLANVQELLSEAREFDKKFNEESKEQETKSEPFSFELEPRNEGNRLERFLEQTALIADVDSWDEQTARVSLMTLHASKGLEFPVVYIIALEDNILPHERSSKDKAQLEEERRLLFVGITRAKEEVRLSLTQFRDYRGTYCSSISSRFLFEFPGDRIDSVVSDGDSNLARPAFSKTPSGRLVELEPADSPSLSRSKAATREKIDAEKFASDSFQGDGSRTAADPKREIDGDEITIEPEPEYADVQEESPEEPVFRYENDSTSNGDERRSDSESTRRSPQIDDDFQNSNADRPTPKRETEPTSDWNGGDRSTGEQSKKRRTSSKKAKSISPSAITLGTDLTDEPETEPTDSASNLESQAVVGGLIRHKSFGIGVLVKIEGPRGDRIATIRFLSAVGTIDLPLSDPKLRVIASKTSR